MLSVKEAYMKKMITVRGFLLIVSSGNSEKDVSAHYKNVQRILLTIDYYTAVLTFNEQ